MAGCASLGSRLVAWLMSWRVLQQFWSLYKKNALVAWRNRRATILRLLAPLLFLLLALLIDKALQANDRNSEAFSDVKNPSAEPVGAIPSCHDDMYIGSKECIELLYSPDNAITRAIMGNVTSRNGNPISALGFPTSTSIQDYLLANPEYALGAVHFAFDDPANSSALSGFILQTNTTVKFFKGSFQDPNTFAQLPIQSAVQREIARFVMAETPSLASAASGLSWNVSLSPFAHPAIATTSVLGQVLGPFVFAALMFSFVSQINFMVTEKEQGMRQSLRTMGMKDVSYWLSWLAWEFTLAFLTGHLIACFGLLLQFNLFLKNNYGLLFFLFFLFQLAMSSLAMFFTAFIKKTQISVYIGFVVFLLGWIMQTVVIFGVPYTPDFYHTANSAITVIFSMFPWCLLAKGFNDLGSATVSSSSPGLDWDERSSYCQNIPDAINQPGYNPNEQYISYTCVMSLDQIYKIYVALWLGYFVLAIYFDNILPNESGVKRPLWYPFMPSFWFPHLAKSNELRRINDAMGPSPVADQAGDDAVLEEEAKTRHLLNHRTGIAGEMAAEGENLARRNAVEVFGLKKVFPAMPCGGCWCCCGSTTSDKAFWAIKGSWFSIEENQLFCLLGPNGAGKSTTINCLTGVLPASNGEALVYGEPISSAGSMERVRSMMGVCPQFDVLWGELSGIEHLRIYANIKGVEHAKVKEQSEMLLEKVKLTAAGKQRTSAYSGGMKRRLSVAIALLGDPKIVYLDEPTTGMDPISRRYVWDIIQECKVGRAIVLTTHSMEEADILGDRIAIMAKGKLRCIGTSLRLKQRFGSGYQVAVSVNPQARGASQRDLTAASPRIEAVKKFFQDGLGLEPFEQSRFYICFQVPRDMEQQLMPFLKRLEAERDALGVTDVQLTLTSLEEVFLNIAKTAELEELRHTDAKPIEVPLPDGTLLAIPFGAEDVQNPVTGVHYRVRWGTDEEGKLTILDCVPVTDAQGVPIAAPTIARRNISAAAPALQSGPPHSIVNDDGTVDVTLPDGTLMRVPVNQEYVLNPVANQPYKIKWGTDIDGRPKILKCDLYVPGEPRMSAEPAAPANFYAPEPGSVPGQLQTESSGGAHPAR